VLPQGQGESLDQTVRRYRLRPSPAAPPGARSYGAIASDPPSVTRCICGCCFSWKVSIKAEKGW